MKASRTGVLISTLPGFLMLILFYSLALHMRRSLGGWPQSIGEAGFSPSLVTHANITMYFFIILLLLAVFIAPTAGIVCLSVRRWRHLAPCFMLFAVLFFVCWGLMQLAPEPFLYWWRD